MTSISLYRATEDMRDLLDQVDESTGELPEGLGDARAVVASKTIACTAYVLNTEAYAEMKIARAKELLASAKADQNRTGKIRAMIQAAMTITGTLSIKSDDGTFSAKLERERDASVDVFDEKQLPQDYMVEVPATFKPDKKLISKAIGDGFDVPGAKIIKKDRLTLR